LDISAFKISDEAGRFLFEIMREKRLKFPIRLELSPGACSWLSLGLSFSKTMVNDAVFRSGGLTFLIDKALLQEAKPIRIDYAPEPSGAKFTIVSNLRLTASCWGCSTDCKNDFTK
jgi:Fe-S cluster assembly iron-binding protein IscA